MQDGQISCPAFAWLGGLAVSRPDGFVAPPSGDLAIDGAVAPADLIQSQFGPAATITVTIAPLSGLPLSPSRHFRHVPLPEGHISPVMTNNRFSPMLPETYRGCRASPPGRTSPVMTFPSAINTPVATSSSPSQPFISLNNHRHFPVFPARNAKTRKSASRFAGF
tara:strand:- start:161 stop:655 length:495 start_codon:yes stop_codon:yes gene_type:complete